MGERNYDFRRRHWEYHKPDRRDPERRAYENEIIKGEDGLLKPENNATRAQIANIFMRYEKSLALASEM